MNGLEKLKALSQKNPLTPGAPWDGKYSLSRAIWLRRSRLGITSALRRWLVSAIGTTRIDLPPYKAAMSYRIGDYGDLMAVEEVFLDRIYDFSKVIVSPALILDVGAHIGSFSICAHQHFPQAPIIAFEPTRASFQLLCRNLADNEIAATTHRAAASNVEGVLRMGGVTAVGAHLGEDGTEAVEVIRLSQKIDLLNSAPLLLKVDVEGAEWDIFEDILEHLPTDVFMFIEVHEGASSVYRLRHVLGPLGFTVHAPPGARSKGLAIDCYATRGCYSAAANGA